MIETVTIRYTLRPHAASYLLRIDYEPGFYNPPDDIDPPEVTITEAVLAAGGDEDNGERAPRRLSETERETLAEDCYDELVEACEAALAPKRELELALEAIADDEAACYADMADGMAEDMDARERRETD